MVDPTVRLALALHSNRGAYAALLGSGISAAAGVPTGWQIVSDLISKVAALEGARVGGDPIGWYRGAASDPPYQPDDEQQDDRADCRRNDCAQDTTCQVNTDSGEQPTCNEGADNSDDEVTH
jgi:hypothetical protein